MSDGTNKARGARGRLDGLIADLIETAPAPKAESDPKPFVIPPAAEAPRPRPEPTSASRPAPSGPPPSLSSNGGRPKPDDAPNPTPVPEPAAKRPYDPLSRVRAASQAKQTALHGPAPTVRSTPTRRPATAKQPKKKKADTPAWLSSITVRKAKPVTQSKDPAPKSAEPRTWDTPADHEMTSGGKALWMLGIYGAIAMVPAAIVLASPFPPKEAVLHHFAALGCNFASMAGLGDAALGEPGYHTSLDPDGNGVACEPEMTARVATGGSLHITRDGAR